MGRLDQILHGILVGCILTAGSIGAYYKIKKDMKPKKEYLNVTYPSTWTTGSGTSTMPYTLSYTGVMTDASKSKDPSKN